jgi:hypothetical protein
MTPPAALSSVRVAERRSRAFLRLLANICRHFPDLRTWLMDDFVQVAKTRENFTALVERGDLASDEADHGFAEVAGELDAWTEEKRHLKAGFQPNTRPFGGFSWDEMESLVRRYEARTIALNLFLLARDWRLAGEAAQASPKLLRGLADVMDTAIRAGDGRPFMQLASAVELLSGLQPGRLKVAFGYADWWKLHALLFMLRHPRPAYRTREIRAHLARLGMQISSLDFRRFCKRHGIARDERAGRPRIRPLVRAAG